MLVASLEVHVAAEDCYVDDRIIEIGPCKWGAVVWCMCVMEVRLVDGLENYAIWLCDEKLI